MRTAPGAWFHNTVCESFLGGSWHAWGPGIFARLRGMFALAMWDQRTQQLILARDRIGKSGKDALDRRRADALENEGGVLQARCAHVISAS